MLRQKGSPTLRLVLVRHFRDLCFRMWSFCFVYKLTFRIFLILSFSIKADVFCNRFPSLCYPNTSLEEFCKANSYFCDPNHESPGNESVSTFIPLKIFMTVQFLTFDCYFCIYKIQCLSFSNGLSACLYSNPRKYNPIAMKFMHIIGYHSGIFDIENEEYST